MRAALVIKTILTSIAKTNNDRLTRLNNLRYIATRVYRIRPYKKNFSKKHKTILLNEWRLLIKLYRELGGQWKHVADIQGLLMSYINPSIRFLLANMTVKDLYTGSSYMAESPLLSHRPDAHAKYDEAKLVILSEAIEVVLRSERAKAQRTRESPGVYQRFVETHTDPQTHW